ncbi:MAG: hypothetical protein AAGK38_08235, partial [Pseudomonadota bacterium]
PPPPPSPPPPATPDTHPSNPPLSLPDARPLCQGKRNDIRIYGGDVIVVYSSSSRIAMQNLKDTLGVARGVRGVVPF